MELMKAEIKVWMLQKKMNKHFLLLWWAKQSCMAITVEFGPLKLLCKGIKLFKLFEGRTKKKRMETIMQFATPIIMKGDFSFSMLPATRSYRGVNAWPRNKMPALEMSCINISWLWQHYISSQYFSERFRLPCNFLFIMQKKLACISSQTENAMQYFQNSSFNQQCILTTVLMQQGCH